MWKPGYDPGPQKYTKKRTNGKIGEIQSLEFSLFKCISDSKRLKILVGWGARYRTQEKESEHGVR